MPGAETKKEEEFSSCSGSLKGRRHRSGTVVVLKEEASVQGRKKSGNSRLKKKRVWSFSMVEKGRREKGGGFSWKMKEF